MSRRVIHKIHRWAGLAALPFIVLEALTGLVVSFHDEIHRTLYPTLSAAQAAAPRRGMDELVAAVRERMPEMRIQRATIAHAVDEPVWFRVVPRDGSGSRQFVLVDPASAQVLLHGSFGRFPCELALTLHASFLAGETGVHLVGISGLVLFLLGVTGVILWWPRAGPVSKQLTVRWRAARALLLLDLHKVVGVAALLFLLLLSLTGALVALRAWLPEPPRHVQALPAGEESDARSGPLEARISKAQRELPGAAVQRVVFGDRSGALHVVAVRFAAPDLPHSRAYHQVSFAASGAALTRYERSSLATRVLDWMLPVHAGEVAGLSGRLLIFLAGVCVLVVCVSGVWMWLERRALKSRAESRVALAETRS